MKKLIMLFMIIGSSLGSYFPMLWGGSLFSMSSIFFGAIGGFAGIWIGYNFSNRFGLS